MSDRQSEAETLPDGLAATELEACERRKFLLGLGKWSKAVIGSVLLGGLLTPGQDAKAGGVWYNSGRGWGGWFGLPGWYNRPRWYNRPYWGGRPYWYNRGWYNGPRYGRPWYNGGGWYNGRG
jgi:hypothetical protein